MVLGRWEVGEEEQLEGEFGRGGHGRGREMVSSYPAANFFFLPFFPPAATLIIIPLRLQGPVPPPGNPFAPGLEGSCRGETGGRGDQNWSPNRSTSLHSPRLSHLLHLDSRFQPTGGHRYRTRRGCWRGNKCPRTNILPPSSSPRQKKKRQSSANSMNASTLRRLAAAAAMAWRHPPIEVCSSAFSLSLLHSCH